MVLTVSVGFSPWSAFVGVIVIGVGVATGIATAGVVKDNAEEIAKKARELFTK